MDLIGKAESTTMDETKINYDDKERSKKVEDKHTKMRASKRQERLWGGQKSQGKRIIGKAKSTTMDVTQINNDNKERSEKTDEHTNESEQEERETLRK
jgi:hypothetical protein